MDNTIHGAPTGRGSPPQICSCWRQSSSGLSRHGAVVIEDAISGVQAGCQGNFGLVIGVARKGNAEELRRQHGAHLVVNDLGELVG